VSEDCTAGFWGIKETPGVAAEGRANEKLRASVSTDGGDVEAGSERETWGRCSDVEVVDPCEPMLRAATSVVGMVGDSIGAFFGGLGVDLREAFPFGPVKKFTSAWRGESVRRR
jgi:hypothetical protein